MEKKKMQNGKMMLCKEMEEILDKGKMTAGDLENLHKLSDTYKNLLKIEMLDEEDDGYSERGRRRDSMGRYSREDGMGYSRGDHRGWEAQGSYDSGSSYNYGHGNYSRDDGKDRMMHTFGELMEGANTEQRRIIQRAMDELRKA